jgi:hypothetical protein
VQDDAELIRGQPPLARDLQPVVIGARREHERHGSHRTSSRGASATQKPRANKARERERVRVRVRGTDGTHSSAQRTVTVTVTAHSSQLTARCDAAMQIDRGARRGGNQDQRSIRNATSRGRE